MDLEFKDQDGEPVNVAVALTDSGFDASVAERDFTGRLFSHRDNYVCFQLGTNVYKAYVAKHEGDYHVSINGKSFVLSESVQDSDHDTATSGSSETKISVPMPGNVVRVMVKEGDTVEAGQGLLVIESMKMESTITAGLAAVVDKVNVQAGDLAQPGSAIVELIPLEG